MALPDDMQVVPVILLKEDVREIEKLARARRQSRSEFLRNLIEAHRPAFFVPARSLGETPDSHQERDAA